MPTVDEAPSQAPRRAPRGDPERLAAAVRRAARQEQFLEVVDRDEAIARFHRRLTLAPVGKESVALSDVRGRVLAEDVVAAIDVPGFDRSNVDGFAIRAPDTAGASDAEPRLLQLNPEVLTPGIEPRLPLGPGTATVIATGGMLPRGADAVLMVEHTDFDEAAGAISVLRPAVAGQFVAFAGSDMARGETVLRRGKVLAASEIAMLAAVGRGEVEVWRRPRVAVLSTGDELVPPGAPLRPGSVYDSNGAVLAAGIEELGGLPVRIGIVADDEALLERRLQEALDGADLVVLSGGTSKGAGDIAHRAVARLGAPGVLVHGVALKPGKPICLAVVGTKPVVVLPGFPTSAMFTFHEFVAPVIRAYAGMPPDPAETTSAILATRLPSERGRREYVMVSLVAAPGEGGGMVAYPTPKGSGAVTAFAQADGFFSIPPLADGVPAGALVSVQRLGGGARPAELVVIGSHCLGLEHLLGLLELEGIGVKTLYVGSTGGLAAAKRGECDLAGVHLLDPESNVYNAPFLTPALELVPGWRRMQGVVFRKDDRRFDGADSAASAVAQALADEGCVMVNRNAGSGTRVLIDRLLAGARPPGYLAQPKSHNAVAVAVAQGRADWGVAISTVADLYGLAFLPLVMEHYDLVVPRTRRERPPVRRLLELLTSDIGRQTLQRLGFEPATSSSEESV
jgi:molybdopterin molybdotransferase/putative molybdopterin biosynthesis protein